VAPCSPLGYAREFHWLGRASGHVAVSFGNLRERSLGGIWASPAYVEFRARARAGQLDARCAGCLKRAGVICPLKHWRWLGEGVHRTSRPSSHA
jgi:MoaA/NifB/PqqE/SkfB family radical SAM enzyme